MSLLFSTGAFASSLATGNPGMVLVKPTSIAHSGTSASIGANGQVTFSAVTSLSLNGCFTDDFDNYVISTRATHTTTSTQIQMVLRASGTNSTSGYTYQTIEVDSTSVAAARATSQTKWFTSSASSNGSGDTTFIYGPYLAQATAMRTVMVGGYLGAYIYEVAGTHSTASSYDGFTFSVPSGSITGALQVYGVRS